MGRQLGRSGITTGGGADAGWGSARLQVQNLVVRTNAVVLKVGRIRNRGAGSGVPHAIGQVQSLFMRIRIVVMGGSAIATEWGTGGGVLDRRDVLVLMHGRSRMTIDPRIPKMPGRSTSGFHRPGRPCLHQARSAVRCPASRMKGELHPTKNRL